MGPDLSHGIRLICIGATMQFWTKAASAFPYTDDVGGSVVVGLLNMTPGDQFLLHMPLVAWGWLNTRPVLPPEFVALLPATEKSMARTIQQLGGAKLIVSKEHQPWTGEFSVMGRLI